VEVDRRRNIAEKFLWKMEREEEKEMSNDGKEVGNSIPDRK